MTLTAILVVSVLVITLAAVLRRIVLQKPFPFAEILTVTCPESRNEATVTVDKLHLWWTRFRGDPQLRLERCSRWPGRLGCDQCCLIEIAPTPEVVAHIFTKCYAGKRCALCNRPLTAMDWQQDRFAALDPHTHLVEWRDIDVTSLPAVLDHNDPLCWDCHQLELLLRPARKSKPVAA